MINPHFRAPYTAAEKDIIREEVKQAMGNGEPKAVGFRRAAETLGRTTQGIEQLYYKELHKKENRSAMYAPPGKVNFVPEDWQLDSVMQEKLDAVSEIYEFINQIWQENLEMKAKLKKYKQDRDEIRSFMIERLGIDKKKFKFTMDNDCVVQGIQEVE